MSMKFFSSRSKTVRELVGDSMNCIIERTERADVEPLRAANALGAEPKYSWITVSATDKPITASNGITFTHDFRLTERPPADFIVAQ